jgi:hypothetical protein
MNLRLLTACCLAVLLAGCGENLKTIPVCGKVRVSGKPLPLGSVSYLPDADKGNNARVTPSGSIDADGNYRLTSKGKPGAPTGWYKVVVRTVIAGMDPTESAKAPKINSSYGSPATTPLSLEVTPDRAPDGYDLKLTP